MSEISNYEAQKKKLQGLCDEHNFTFRFFKDRYPITLVITPINDVATAAPNRLISRACARNVSSPSA